MFTRVKRAGQYVFEAWIKRYERYLTAGALFFGFIFDTLTLTRIDFLYENVVIVGYLILGMAMIILSALYTRRHLKNMWLEKIGAFAPIVLQFTFGGLFSAFLVFFVRSASFVASWPFLLLLSSVLVGNEFFKERYSRFSFQIFIWYFALYLYLALVMPVIVGRIGFLVFLASGTLALLLVYSLIRALEHMVPTLMHELRQAPLMFMVGLFAVFNVLYVLNIIPPIPLSLKEAGVYEYVARVGDTYIKERTERSFLKEFFLRDRIELLPGKPAYFFSSVFSPTNLEVEIIHHWQRYNEDTNRWMTVAYIPFIIRGGRDAGYRGFTLLQHASAGMWRVRVETGRGQLLGRETFYIVSPQVSKSWCQFLLPDAWCE